MEAVDLATEPDGTGAVLAALAARDATDRQSALPESLLAAEAELARTAVQNCCGSLVAGEYIEKVTWDDDGEELPGYFLTDIRAKNQGLQIWNDERSLGAASP